MTENSKSPFGAGSNFGNASVRLAALNYDNIGSIQSGVLHE